MIKRGLDIVLSLMGLLVLCPIFLILGLFIRMESKGPIIFKQTRTGRQGKLFEVYKLRTMVTDDSRSAIYTTPSDDPRITKVGNFIRRYNLDELPQFANVLKGDMSIVGPRPEIPQYTALYSDEEKKILSVRPGITDLATLWIRDKGDLVLGSEDPEEIYLKQIRPEKIRLQLQYVEEKSTLLDIKIMFKTFKSHLLDRLVKHTDRIEED